MDLISVKRKSGLEFEIGIRGHRIAYDMPESDGGKDAGPSPAELFSASLGACVAMMAQSYCQRHGYEGDVGVSLTMELAENPKRVGRIVVDLELPDSVPEDKVEAVKKVAERCPIHMTLKDPPAMDIDVV